MYATVSVDTHSLPMTYKENERTRAIGYYFNYYIHPTLLMEHFSNSEVSGCIQPYFLVAIFQIVFGQDI
jgi:hypothetical protein